MNGIKIAVIGGGSSYTPELIDGIIKRKDELPVSEICLIDIQDGMDKLYTVKELASRMCEKSNLDIKVTATLDRRNGIREADFVITQFRVGGLKAREKDESIPLRYNLIGQETTGAGGFAKALRTIPVILDICKDIEELAPDAWLINFTNPAGIITEAVLKQTKVKVIGLCNVPISMKFNIAHMLKVEKNRIKIDFIGLNHMVYGKKVYLDNEDVTEKVLELIAQGESFTMKNIPDLKWHRGLIESLKLVPCPYHRYFYMKEDIIKEESETIKNGGGTRATQVLKIEEKLFELYKDIDLNEKPKELEKRGGANYSDAAISLVSAIYNDKNEIHTVNVRNNGAIANLDRDAVVEVNCVVNSLGAHPIIVGELSDEVEGLVKAIKAYEKLTVWCAIYGDYNRGIMALVTNPLVGDFHAARNVFKDIIKENKDYLPQFAYINEEE